VETDEPRCVVVLPADVFKPAVEAADMVPEPAVSASSQRDKRHLCNQINGADVVVADLRSLEPFCYFAARAHWKALTVGLLRKNVRWVLDADIHYRSTTRSPSCCRTRLREEKVVDAARR
jgi:hypothetical protein